MISTNFDQILIFIDINGAKLILSCYTASKDHVTAKDIQLKKYYAKRLLEMRIRTIEDFSIFIGLLNSVDLAV